MNKSGNERGTHLNACWNRPSARHQPTGLPPAAGFDLLLPTISTGSPATESPAADSPAAKSPAAESPTTDFPATDSPAQGLPKVVLPEVVLPEVQSGPFRTCWRRLLN
jgi:hypothetical protein